MREGVTPSLIAVSWGQAIFRGEDCHVCSEGGHLTKFYPLNPYGIRRELSINWDYIFFPRT